MSVEIRTATLERLEAIAPLFDAYRAFFTKVSDPEGSKRFLADRLRNADSAIFVADEDGAAVGFLQLYPLFSSWYAGRIWFLSDLYVCERARKRDIGRTLVRRAIDFSRETNASSIMVELPFSEPHLAQFYSELGFRADPTFQLYRCALG